MRPSRSLRVPVRGLDYHVRAWGDPRGRTVFLLHGWMDVSASFQFLVDALPEDWQVLAPDWRGFGLTESPQDGYWFADYVADLDALARALSPDAPLLLAGHSLGANVAMHYAGVRAARVARIAALDGFGVHCDPPERAPGKYRKWLDALVAEPAFAPYASMAAVADRLQKNNPRLPRDKALWLALHWAEELPDGTARLRADPKHKRPFPINSHLEDWYAVWREIKAPVLWMQAADSEIGRWLAGGGDAMAEIARRFAHVPNGTLVTIEEASHMLHHDQPEAVARHLAAFFAEPPR